MIVFNKPYFTGKETDYIMQAVVNGKISGNGLFTKKCHNFFQQRYRFNKVLLTTSCTTALEMAAILIDTQPGDEIIMPSYTFVSTANAFVLRGAKIIFADSSSQNPNLDSAYIEKLITPKTKAIVVVHYAGIACDMDKIKALADAHSLFIIEDAAQAIDSYYNGAPLGSIGHLGCFSFHETKNIMAGEGGMLVINDERFIKRAEIVWEKGTNRLAFFRGEVDKYTWMDVGSSFLPSDMIAAFLYAQLENLDDIQNKRKEIWHTYYTELKHLAQENLVTLPYIPPYATNNAHMFYLVCKNLQERTALIHYLKENGIHAIFHYLPLHSSTYFQNKHNGNLLPQSERYADCLVRLPLFYEMTPADIQRITCTVNGFFKEKLHTVHP